MAKFLKAEKQATQYYFEVLIDESKLDASGNPDASFVRAFSFPVIPPDGMNNKDYLNELKADLAALVRYENVKLELANVTVPQDMLSFFAS